MSAHLSDQSTGELLLRARAGDRDAVGLLCTRYLPRLHRWAGRRLPRWARGRFDTDDLVQETFVRTIGRLDRVEADGGARFQVWMREVLHNRLADELRRLRREPGRADMPDSMPDAGPSPLEDLISAEEIRRYEAALSCLTPPDQAAIVARLEMGLSYAEVAVELEKPTANAARMAVTRAVERLASALSEAGRSDAHSS